MPYPMKKKELKMKQLLEELVDLEYDIRDTLTRLIDRVNYLSEQLKKETEKAEGETNECKRTN